MSRYTNIFIAVAKGRVVEIPADQITRNALRVAWQRFQAEPLIKAKIEGKTLVIQLSKDAKNWQLELREKPQLEFKVL